MLSFSPSLKVTGQLILARYQPSCQQGKHTVRVSVCLPLGWGDGQAHARGRFNQNWEAVFTKKKEMYLKKRGGRAANCLSGLVLPPELDSASLACCFPLLLEFICNHCRQFSLTSLLGTSACRCSLLEHPTP